jgi:hypothetical protein
MYTVKLEAAKLTGWRTIFMGSFRDLILISQLDVMLELIKEHVRKSHQHIDEEWDLHFHVYGLPPDGKIVPNTEVMIIGEAKAESQTVATSIASAARVACVHGPYPGQKATSGNFAMSIGGVLAIETGQCSEFSIYHLMELFEGEEHAQQKNRMDAKNENGYVEELMFQWEIKVLGNAKSDAHGEEEGVDRERKKKTKKEKPVARKQKPMNGFHDATADVLKGTLGQIASIVRSKNSGPFEITFDVFFSNDSIYHKVKASGVLRKRVISELYDVSEEEVIWSGFYDQALGFKSTIPRKKNGRNVAAGGFMEDDVHAST